MHQTVSEQTVGVLSETETFMRKTTFNIGEFASENALCYISTKTWIKPIPNRGNT